jgi:hypothetical protein
MAKKKSLDIAGGAGGAPAPAVPKVEPGEPPIKKLKAEGNSAVEKMKVCHIRVRASTSMIRTSIISTNSISTSITSTNIRTSIWT